VIFGGYIPQFRGLYKMRFQVHDDLGHLRSFHSKSDATRFLSEGKCLVILPKKKKEKFDFSKFEDAPF
jgi:hypothetical protein